MHFLALWLSVERGDFVVNSQQDVPEVLNYLLDKFCGISVLAQDQIRVVIRKMITCRNCLQSDDREDIRMIVKLNVAGNVNAAFNNFLNEEVILNREMSSLLANIYVYGYVRVFRLPLSSPSTRVIPCIEILKRVM